MLEQRTSFLSFVVFVAQTNTIKC